MGTVKHNYLLCIATYTQQQFNLHASFVHQITYKQSSAQFASTHRLDIHTFVEKYITLTNALHACIYGTT